MIKSFVVKVKAVKYAEKGLKNLVKYLEDKKRHKKTKILHVTKNKEAFIRTAILNATEKQLSNKRGRKITSLATSYIFTFPKGIKPTREEYKATIKQIINFIAEETNTPPNIIRQQMFINIHEQENTHINVLVSKAIKFKDKVKTIDLTKKAHLARARNFWTKTLIENLNLNPTDHIPETKSKFTRKGKVPTDIKKQIDDYFEEKLQELIEEFNKHLQKELRKDKLIKRLVTYANRYKKKRHPLLRGPR